MICGKCTQGEAHSLENERITPGRTARNLETRCWALRPRPFSPSAPTPQFKREEDGGS